MDSKVNYDALSSDQLQEQIEDIKKQIQDQLSKKLLIIAENKNKQELYNSLKAKQLQVRKELEDFKQDQEDEGKRDSNSSNGSKNEGDSDNDKNDEMGSESENDKKDNTLVPMKPEELLKEKDWDKIIKEEVILEINNQIDVLKQDYNKEKQKTKKYK